MKPMPILAFLGHHKCASTWMCGICRPVSRELGLNFAYLPTSKSFDEDLAGHIRKNAIGFFCYVNANIDCFRKLPKFRAFHMIRDPRDVLVSAYFSHLHSHGTNNWPELIEYRDRLKKVDLAEGLFLEMDFRKQQYQEMHDWNYSQPNILEVKMEDAIQNPHEKIVEIFNFLGIVDNHIWRIMPRLVREVNGALNRARLCGNKWIPFRLPQRRIPLERILLHIHQNRYSVKSGGRTPGQENIYSHYRKGVPSDWMNYFGTEHKKAFKERFNHVLVKLGYEKDANW